MKDIISIHIRYFKTEGIKKFIFCLRDFDEEHESFEDLDMTIRESLDEIWSEIPKPKTNERIKRKDVFSIEVFPLRSYRTNFEGFKVDCKKLMKRINSFNDAGTGNLPLNGFKAYLEQAWESIKNDKDLNIPSQKKIVSNVRCKEEAYNVLNKSNVDFKNLEEEIGRKSITALASKLKDIISTSQLEYEELTMYYDKDVKNENKKNMKENMNINVKNFLKKSFMSFEDKQLAKLEVMINQINQKRNYDPSVLNYFIDFKLEMKENSI